MLHSTLALVASLLFAQDAATDWPQYLGPNRDNRVGPIDSKFDWGADGPEVLWRQPVAPGFGGPAVQGGEVFLLDRDGTDGDVLRVFDLKSGEERWSEGYPAPGRVNFDGTRCVPVVDAERVVTVGPFGQVAAFDRKSHGVAWMNHMGEVFGGLEPMFGWSNSALLVDGKVIVTVLGEEVGLVALDAKSGEEVWVSTGLGYSHSTPTVMELLGERWLVFLSTTYQTSGVDQAAPTQITALDIGDGSIEWQTETLLTRLPVPPPVKIDESRFFLTGGYRSGSTMMRIAKGADGYAFEELFHIARGSQVHVPLLHDEHLYLVVNENWTHSRRNRAEGGLLCLSLAGEEVWRTGEAPFLGRGGSLLAGDTLILLDGDTGVLHVARASADGYRELAQADLFGKPEGPANQFWAPLALSGNLLLARGQDELVCVRL